MPLTRWTLRSDPANRGHRGWLGARRLQRQDGERAQRRRTRTPTAARGGAAQLRRLGRVVSHELQRRRSAANTRWTSSRRTSRPRSGWTGARSARTAAPTCPSSCAAGSRRAAHTVVVRVDWRNPAAQSRKGFHRTWFNWGGLERRGRRAPDRRRASSRLRPCRATLARAKAAAATVKVSVQVRNYGPSRTLTPEGSLAHGAQTHRPELRAGDARARRSTSDRERHGDGARTGAVVAGEPRASTS